MDAKNFRMPPIEAGRVVLYYVDGDRESAPCPGIVLVDTGHHVTLAAIRGFASRIEIFDGVMHVNDPKLKTSYNDSGAWDYTEFDKKVMRMLRDQQPTAAPSGAPVKRPPGRPRKNPEPVST